MPKVGNEWNDITNSSAVADLRGRRFGRVAAALGKSLFRVTWDDGEQEILPRTALLARHTVESAGFRSRF